MPNLRTIDQDGTERRSVRAVPVLRVVLVVEGTEDDDPVLHRTEHNDVRRTLIFDNSRFGFQVGESHRLSSSFRRCNSHMGTSKNRIA